MARQTASPLNCELRNALEFGQRTTANSTLALGMLKIVAEDCYQFVGFVIRYGLPRLGSLSLSSAVLTRVIPHQLGVMCLLFSSMEVNASFARNRYAAIASDTATPLTNSKHAEVEAINAALVPLYAESVFGGEEWLLFQSMEYWSY